MSYPISKEVLSLFENQYRQVVEIRVEGLTETMTLTEKDIGAGGLVIDRYCVSGSRIEIGSAVAAELSLTLDNNDGRFDDTVFEGAEMFVRVGIKDWDSDISDNNAVHYIPMGYFTVDNPPRKLSSISLSALDRMVQFDKICNPDDISFPMDINTLLVRTCSICGVILATNSSTLTNCDYIIDKYPESDNLTYRQILMWIAEITGTCAYIDWNGHLRLEWYGEEVSATLSPDVRYSSDLNDKPITITGVKITALDETVYLQGTDEYAFNIEANGLLQNNVAVAATALNKKLNGFTYTPYSCVVKPLVHLYPLDRVEFVDRKGNKVPSIVTNTTFSLNANLSLMGQGETETENGYATANPITQREATIINSIKNVIGSQITTRQQSIIELNKTIVNSLGLYLTEEVLEDGSSVYYYHDLPEKENSSIIYTFRAGGFAWTDKWDGDNTVWQNGIDRNGNAVLNVLSAFQINSEHIEAGSITADRLAVDFTQTIVTEDDLFSTTNVLRQEFIVAYGELTSEIDKKLTAYATTIEMKSAIEQNANSINLSVDEKLTAYATTIEMKSAIEMVNNRIGLFVTETANGDVINSASIIAAINNDTSAVTINAGKIDLTSYAKTSEVYNEAYAAAGDAVSNGISISAINGATSSTILLQYNGIYIGSTSVSFTGAVTFSDLQTEGRTTINGANITAGIISADRISTNIARVSQELYIGDPNSSDQKYIRFNSGAVISTYVDYTGGAGTGISISGSSARFAGLGYSLYDSPYLYVNNMLIATQDWVLNNVSGNSVAVFG